MSTNPEPLTRDEIEFRQRQAEDMLASWRAEKPTSSHKFDVQAVSITRYEDELRYLATIADLQARALDEVPAWDSDLSDEGKLFLSLDSPSLHFEIEVKPDGRAEWFFRNRATDESEGNTDADFLPERMAVRYREVLSAIREEIARRKGTP